MFKYPKINTIWKRNKNNKYIIIEGDYSCPEFENIKKWYVTEKIHGQNIRVSMQRILTLDAHIEFRARTDKGDVPKFLLTYLEDTFKKEDMLKAFIREEKIIHPIEGEMTIPKLPDHVILFGEGYGKKIQKGGEKYLDKTGFILFDIWIDGWWLDIEKVKNLADAFGIPHVPEIGIMTIPEIEEYVKSKPNSVVAKESLTMEGVVAKSYPLMLFRNGNPMTFKLKVEDYEKLERFGKR